jgi:uncharacterized protein (AIM24 family)
MITRHVSFGGAALAALLAAGCAAGTDGELLLPGGDEGDRLLEAAGAAGQGGGDFGINSTHIWSAAYGGAGGDRGPVDMALDSSDNILLAGGFEGTVDFGGGPLTALGLRGMFVAKLDDTGAHLWSHSYGSALSTFQVIVNIAVDSSGNVLLAGVFDDSVDFGGGPLTTSSRAMFVAKLDSSGNHVWSQSFDCFCGGRVAVDSSGNVLLAGSFDGTLDLGGGTMTDTSQGDLFVAKFAANGAHVWSQSYTNGDPLGFQGAEGITVDSADNVIVAGDLEGSVNMGGGTLAGQADVYVAKLNSSGVHQWSQKFGDPPPATPDYQHLMALAVDGSDNVLLMGAFYGTIDFGGGPLSGSFDTFVAKLNASGVHQWSQIIASVTSGLLWTADIATDSSDNLLLTGYHLFGTVDFGGGPLTTSDTSAVVAKFDPSGTHDWSQMFDDISAGVTILPDSTDNVVLTGNFSGIVDFGGGPLTSSSSGTESSVFVATFTP